MPRKGLSTVKRMLDAQEQTPEKMFLNDLKKSIEKTEEDNYHKPTQTYKPSSMQCIRNMYYQRMGVEVEPSFSATMTMICNSGTDTHQRIQQAITEMVKNEFDCEYMSVSDYVWSRELTDLVVEKQNGFETKLRSTNYPLVFMCDGIIRYRGKYYILEIKTENSNKFLRRNYVDSKHFDQAIAYATFLKIPEVLFLYISRDTLDMKSYIFKVTDEMSSRMLTKLDICEQHVEDKDVPEKPTISETVCRYCAYRKQCEEDNKDECSNG